MSHTAFKYFYIDHGQLVIIPLSGVQSFMEVNWACASGVIHLPLPDCTIGLHSKYIVSGVEGNC